MTEIMHSPILPFVPKHKKNRITPLNEDQLEKSKTNLPPLDININTHKTSCEMHEFTSGIQTLSNQSARCKSVSYDTPKGMKKAQKSPIRKHKFSLEVLGGRLDSFGYPIIKGGKKHKILFKEDLVKVIKVDNWKAFNIDSSYDNNRNWICGKCVIM